MTELAIQILAGAVVGSIVGHSLYAIYEFVQHKQNASRWRKIEKEWKEKHPNFPMGTSKAYDIGYSDPNERIQEDG